MTERTSETTPARRKREPTRESARGERDRADELRVSLRRLRERPRARSAAKKLSAGLRDVIDTRGLEETQSVLRRAEAGLGPLDAGSWALSLLEREQLQTLIDELSTWSDEDAAHVLTAVQSRWETMCNEGRFTLTLTDVRRWVDAHAADSDRGERIARCITLDAPVEVQINRLLTEAGKQKRVFEASWIVADEPTNIVVKQIRDPAASTFNRDRRPHPLSMRHPNIIETFTLANAARTPEQFTVEAQLRVLDNDLSLGWAESAQLLLDLGRALAFLSDQGLVHGDIKPENVGYADGRFILLDFGICRTAPEFRDLTEPTGTLQTRAPEVLLRQEHQSERSDVWALGAIVFKALTGTFPLYKDRSEEKDRKPAERKRFEAQLRSRCSDSRQWKALLGRLNGTGEHRALNQLLRDILVSEPLEWRPGERRPRPRAADVVRRCVTELESLVGVQSGAWFEATNELQHVRRYLSDDHKARRLLSDERKRDLSARIDELERMVRAKQHHRRAGEALASQAAMAMSDPDASFTVADTEALLLLSRAGEVKLEADKAAAQLIAHVRSMLGEGESEPTEDLLDTLGDALRRVRESSSLSKYRDGLLAQTANRLTSLLED